MGVGWIKTDRVPHEQRPERDASHAEKQPERKENPKRLREKGDAGDFSEFVTSARGVEQLVVTPKMDGATLGRQRKLLKPSRQK